MSEEEYFQGRSRTHLQVKQPDIDLGLEKTFFLAKTMDAITSEDLRAAHSWGEVGRCGGTFHQSSGVIGTLVGRRRRGGRQVAWIAKGCNLPTSNPSPFASRLFCRIIEIDFWVL